MEGEGWNYPSTTLQRIPCLDNRMEPPDTDGRKEGREESNTMFNGSFTCYSLLEPDEVCENAYSWHSH